MLQGSRVEAAGLLHRPGELVPPVGGAPCSGATLELKVHFIIYLYWSALDCVK